jgi:exodeoxyribonuclease V alpha subunit
VLVVPTTLTGEVERVTYENEETGFRVLRVGSVDSELRSPGPLAVVGKFQAVGPGTRVRVTGEFFEDPRHGRQFRAISLVALAPSTLSGIEKYLGSGLIPGIGPGFAKRIVSQFGMETLTVLDRQPERLSEVSGLGATRVSEIKKAWTEQRAISNVMMLLQTHGASAALAARIFRHYGERSAEIVQRFPYRLALDVRGVGFKTADRLARSLGIAGDHPERAQAGALHELHALTEQGHVYAPRTALVERTAAMLEIDAAHVESALDALWASERVVIEDDAVYPARLHQAESALAKNVVRLLESPGRVLHGLEGAVARFEQQSGVKLAPEQRRAVQACTEHKLVVITGGPGVGKTTIVRAIVSVLDQSRLAFQLAAPTGRAAKRLSEATRREAMTIHRLLEFDPRAGTFARNSDNPLSADALILDEASMIDLPLAAAVLDALSTAARLVIVGDADQLASVGPGAVLRDLLATRGVPRVELSEVFRQAQDSHIVLNAHRLNRGEMPENAPAEDAAADFFVIPRKDAQQAADVMLELVTQRIPRRFALDAVSDIQVLCPMHAGAAGTAALNAALQASLNPEGASLEAHGQKFRAADKVMQTKNDYQREVYNGDIGRVVSVSPEERTLVVRFDGRDVEYQDGDLQALVLAYAISIHKSQGSEYAAVVIPLLTSHFVMLSKNLVYTAVTRAKKLCILVADPRALRLALAEDRREERSTRLSARIESAARGIT